MTDFFNEFIDLAIGALAQRRLRESVMYSAYRSMLEAMSIAYPYSYIRPEVGAFIAPMLPPRARQIVSALARDVIGRFYASVLSSVGIRVAEFYTSIRNAILSRIPYLDLREALARRDRFYWEALLGYENLLAYIPDYRLSKMEKQFFSKVLRREKIINEPEFLDYLRDLSSVMPFHPKDKKDIVYGAMKEMGIEVTKNKLKYVLGYDYYRAQGYL